MIKIPFSPSLIINELETVGRLYLCLLQERLMELSLVFGENNGRDLNVTH